MAAVTATPGPPGIVDLLAATAALVDIPSESRSEAALADHVEAALRVVRWLAVDRVGDNVVARHTAAGSADAPPLILAGHLDTVPANGNGRARIEGDTLWGLGSADMKGGLAVFMELAASVERVAVPVTYVFYAREEIDRRHNGLLEIAEVRPDLLEAGAAVLGEPTGAVVEAGCQGVIKARVTVGGRRAHTARPWTGVNAIHRLAPVISALASVPERTPTIDGCRYREALSAVLAEGGVAANVVPDRASVTLSHRFAPDRDAAAAEAWLRRLVEPLLDPGQGDDVEILESAPSAAPGLDHPALAAIVRATGVAPRAKLGWTDVAFFAGRGVPAVNFGPGDPEVAHRADERVERHELDTVLAVLRAVISPS